MSKFGYDDYRYLYDRVMGPIYEAHELMLKRKDAFILCEGESCSRRLSWRSRRLG